MGQIYKYKVLESTNETAKKILEDNVIITADKQTFGKGRRGKSFYSPEGGVYMSIILKTDFLDVPYLSSAASVGVCRAIMKLSDLKPKIKWINDIYIENKKAGGILIESFSGFVIIGIGINLNIKNFPKEIEAVSLNVDIDKEKLIEEIYNQIVKIIETKDFIEDYKKLSNILGNEIIVCKKDIQYRAFATDITDIGELVIRKENNEFEILNSADISIIT